MIGRAAKALFAAVLAAFGSVLPAHPQANFPQVMPADTVYGSQFVSGPGVAIPFSVLAQRLFSVTGPVYAPLVVGSSAVTGGVPNCVLFTKVDSTLNCTSLLTVFVGSSTLDVAGSVNIVPPASSLATGLVIVQTPAGSSAPAADAVNLLFIPSDNAVMTGVGRFLNLFEISYVCCSSLAQGGRSGFSSFMTVSSPPSASNVNNNYQSTNFFTNITANLNGTGITPVGAGFGNAVTSLLQSGATFIAESTGEIIDIGAMAGSSVFRRFGLHLTYQPGDAVAGSDADAVIGISSSASAPTAKNFILMGNWDTSFPIATTGCLWCMYSTATVAKGIDWTGMTFSTAPLKIPLPASAGGGGIFVCVDSTGVFYKKSTCP
jgi:hypothetical protein